MILSFAWTTEALLAGRKTCTRRVWKDLHFRRWCNAWDQERKVHQAWSRVAFAGGRHVADVELACRPYKERLADMPLADLEAEGGLWDSLDEFVGLFGGLRVEVAVVRFELARVLPGPYPSNWNEVADQVKGRAGYHCEHCGHPNDRESGHVLTVHHLNGNPADCRFENLVALCQRCHLRIQAAYCPGQQVLPGIEAPEWMSVRGLA